MGNKKVGRILISDFSALADQQYSTRMQRLLIGYRVVKLKPGYRSDRAKSDVCGRHCVGRAAAEYSGASAESERLCGEPEFERFVIIRSFLTGDSTGNGDSRSGFPKFILRAYGSLLQSVCVL